MKTTILAIATLFTLCSTSAFAQSEEKLKPGDKMPAMNMQMKNANEHYTLKGSQHENGLLVMFSCNTCPFVIRNEPITKKVMEYAIAHHVGMVIFNSNEAKRTGEDSYEAMKKYAEEQGYQVPYIIDENSKLADMFGAGHTPEVFLFNRESKLVYKGAMNDNPSNPGEYKRMYIEEAIDAMIAGKEPNPATTKSIGCSIKRKA